MTGIPVAMLRPGRCDLFPTRGYAASVRFTFPAGSDMSGVDACIVTDGDTDIDLSASIVVSGDDNEIVTISWTAEESSAMAAGSDWSWYLADSVGEVAYIEGDVNPSDIRGSGVGSAGSSTVEVSTIDGTLEVTVSGLGPPGAGLPAGGTTGQTPAKASDDDYDIEWTASGSGDVSGPASVTSQRLVRFADGTGKVIEDAGFTSADLGTAALVDTGTGIGEAVVGGDARLTDARTPTSHASDHDTGGGDAITSLAASVIDSGTLAAARVDAVAETLIDAKGDIVGGSAADTAARLAVGTNDQVLTADAGTATGLKWADTATGTTATNGATGATESLAFAEAPSTAVYDMTMDESCTFSFTGAPASGTVGSMTVIVRGAFTPTFPAAVDWAGGSAPTYESPSVYEFVTVDGGTTVLGFLAGATIT